MTVHWPTAGERRRNETIVENSRGKPGARIEQLGFVVFEGRWERSFAHSRGEVIVGLCGEGGAPDGNRLGGPSCSSPYPWTPARTVAACARSTTISPELASVCRTRAAAPHAEGNKMHRRRRRENGACVVPCARRLARSSLSLRWYTGTAIHAAKAITPVTVGLANWACEKPILAIVLRGYFCGI